MSRHVARGHLRPNALGTELLALLSSSSYITHTERPTPFASGLLGSSATRTMLPGMLVFEVLNVAVLMPARAASSAPPCHAIRRPPPWTHARSAFLPVDPSAWRP